MRRGALFAVAAFLLLRARRWFPVAVVGDSMRPTLQPGDLLAARPLRAPEPLAGQVVVARVGEREVVKRVSPEPRPLRHDEVWVVGDNGGHSTDSRSVGPVAINDVVGVVWLRYWPPGRVGLL